MAYITTDDLASMAESIKENYVLKRYNTAIIEITQAEYDLLSESDKNSHIYYVKDDNGGQ